MKKRKPRSSRKPGSSSDAFKLKKMSLFKFYDQRFSGDEEKGSPVTAVTSLIGEDVVLGLLEQYLRTAGKDAVVRGPIYKCNTGEQRGPRLDAWIRTRKHLYQVEVKNWCASAIGGVEVGIENETRGRKRRRMTWLKAAIHNRERYLDHKDVAKKVWKALVSMKPPKTLSSKKPIPLLAFWSPVAPVGAKKDQDLKAFFPVATKHFRKTIAKAGLRLRKPHPPTVWVFSASNYLRGNKNNNFKVRMPRVAQRLEELRELGIKVT
jgi:hypothetical protein